jgi:hypothetical protein
MSDSPEATEEIHHSVFVMISLAVLVVAAGLGYLQVQAAQAKIEENRKAKKYR